jgi:DNA-binding CsgD family transcriptional regulator
LTKPVSTADLLRAIERAIAQHEVTRGLKSQLDVVRSRIATLTPRQRQVLELVIRGSKNKHVARALGCTERTIKAHRHKVMEKMQVRSLPELVFVAERIDIASAAGHSLGHFCYPYRRCKRHPDKAASPLEEPKRASSRACAGINNHACQKGRTIDLGQCQCAVHLCLGMPSFQRNGPET